LLPDGKIPDEKIKKVICVTQGKSKIVGVAKWKVKAGFYCTKKI